MSAENGRAPDRLALTSEIVSAFVGYNAIAVSELPDLIAAVHARLSELMPSPPPSRRRCRPFRSGARSPPTT